MHYEWLPAGTHWDVTEYSLESPADGYFWPKLEEAWLRCLQDMSQQCQSVNLYEA